MSVALLALLFTAWTAAIVGLVRDAWDLPVENPPWRPEWDYHRNKAEWERTHQLVRPPKDVRDAGALAVAQEMREWAGEEEGIQATNAVAMTNSNTNNRKEP